MEDMSAIYYEFVIRRAFNCSRFQKGANADLFRRLTEDEYYLNESALDKKLQRKCSKQLAEIKEYLVKALNQAIKLVKNDADAVDLMLDNISAVRIANDSKELTPVVSKTLSDYNEFNIGKE